MEPPAPSVAFTRPQSLAPAPAPAPTDSAPNVAPTHARLNETRQGFRVLGWTEFRAVANYDVTTTTNSTNHTRVSQLFESGNTRTLNFVADVKCETGKGDTCPSTNVVIGNVRSSHQNWFDDNAYSFPDAWQRLSTKDKKWVLQKDKTIDFKVMPAYQQAIVTEVTYDSDEQKAYNNHKHDWQGTVTFRNSQWDEGTSCYNPYDEEWIDHSEKLKVRPAKPFGSRIAYTDYEWSADRRAAPSAAHLSRYCRDTSRGPSS